MACDGWCYDDFRLSRKPRTKAFKGSINHPIAVGASFCGGSYVSVLGRLDGRTSESSMGVSSESSRSRFVPKGILGSDATSVPSVDDDDGGGREGKVMGSLLAL